MNNIKQKLIAFAYIFKNSLLSPKYYQQVVQQSFGFSFKYYFVLAILASLFIGATAFWSIVPEAKKGMNEILQQGTALYPADLVVTIKEGKLSINQPTPYIISVPDELIKNETDFPKNLIVFNPAGTLDDLEKYDTVCLINEVNILMQDSTKGKIQTFPLKDIPDGELSKDVIEKWAMSAKPYINVIAYGIFGLLFVFVFINNLVFKFVDFVLVGLILLIVGKIKGVGLGFGKYLQIGMHAATLGFVLDIAFGLVRYTPPVGMWFFVSVLVYGLVVVFGIAGNKQTAVTESK